MVFREDQHAWRLWPLGRSAKHVEKDQLDDDTDEWERERGRAFEIADVVEKGLARELVTEFMQPLRRSSKLWRFNVLRTEDRLQYRLLANDGEFLLYARFSLEDRRVSFFLYDPGGREQSLYDASRPAFTMTFSEDGGDWLLVQERCEHCTFLPRHASCACKGKQQVLHVRHVRKNVGNGVFNCLDVRIPGLLSDGTRLVWCPLLGRGDLSAAPDDTYEVQRLRTRQPVWNDEVDSLVLDFKGRNVVSSAKNFQLALRQKPEHVICQYGRLGPTTFGLDFRYPLSVVQAFGVSLTTLFWK